MHDILVMYSECIMNSQLSVGHCSFDDYTTVVTFFIGAKYFFGGTNEQRYSKVV